MGNAKTAATKAVLVLVGLLGAARPGVAGELVVPVEVRDYAALPPSVIQAAQAGVAAIFEDAGIRVIWIDASQQVANVRVEGVVTVNILPRVPERVRLHGEALGFTQVTSGTGRFVNVINSQIEDLRVVHAVGKATLLAAAMAHEIGHLLMPGAPHSARGIMRASFTEADLRRADQGRLGFLPLEVQLLQKAAETRRASSRD